MNPTIIILAGGLGKRMGSDLPKVLHLVGGVPMIVRILQSLPPDVRILVVVGKYKDIIQDTIRKYTDVALEYVVQDPALGTGHAIACCLPHISVDDSVVVLSGDVPLIRRETIAKMFVGNPELRVLTMFMEDPTGYGRIIYASEINGSRFVKIVEEKDCSDTERACQIVNCGIYGFCGEVAHRFIPLIQNVNAQREYYLTDIVGLAYDAGIDIETYKIEDEHRCEVVGINTLAELNAINGV